VDYIEVVEIGTLVVGVVILVIAVLTLRNAQRSVQLAEKREEYLIEERERMEFMRQEHKSLQEELAQERQESQSLQEALKQERQERLQAQQRAERAEQEALREATQQLRERMDNYLNELEGTGELAIRRVK
jgi:biopolymer transport protein ExbB/TolQ